MLCNGYEYFLNIPVEPYGYAVFRIQLVPVVCTFKHSSKTYRSDRVLASVRYGNVVALLK